MGATDSAPRELHVRNPRTGENDYTIMAASAEEVASISQKAREGQQAWAALGVKGRGDMLKAWAGGLSKNTELLEALVVDTGRRKIAEVEISACMGMVFGRAMAAERLLLESATHRDSMVVPTVAIHDQFDPIPLIGVVSPWNFPLLLAMIDTIPALIAGCAVLLKPSEVTPRFAKHLQASLEGFPVLASALRIVMGDGVTGAAVVDNVDAVAFTGSVKTGKIILQACSKRFIPCFLELGGKDPLIVLPSADMDYATRVALRASVQATGQACQSLERIYVPNDRLDEFTKLLAQKADAVELTYPDPNKGQLGPLIFDQQAKTIEAHIQDAVDKGAKVLTGGKIERHGGGIWIRPTVISGANHEMKVVMEETFGPLMPVMGYESLDQAVALANDSEYGLSAALVGDEAECETLARRLKAGAIGINDGAMTAFVADCPHTVYGFSGMGECRQGDSGIMRYVRRKSILIQKAQAKAIEDNDEKFAESTPKS